MQKFYVTDELSALLRTIRSERKITAKQLSAGVKKSPSYISKLENREIRSIAVEELTGIFDYILEGEDFFRDKFPVIVARTKEMCGEENMAEQLWLLNYDICLRPLQVPAALAEDIVRRMNEADLDRETLRRAINANRDSSVSESAPANELLRYEHGGKRHFLMIRVHLTAEELDDLLDRKTDTTYYYVLQSVIYDLFRKDFAGNRRLKAAEARQLIMRIRDYLAPYGIQSLVGYGQLVAQYNNPGEKESNVDYVSSSNTEVWDRILKIIGETPQGDLLAANQMLDDLEKNLLWDQAFMYKLLSMEFSSLDPISFTMKKQLLEEIGKLLKKYERMPESVRKYESY